MVFSCGDRHSCYTEKVPNFIHFTPLFPGRENPSAFSCKCPHSPMGPDDLAAIPKAPLSSVQSVSSWPFLQLSACPCVSWGITLAAGFCYN